MGYLIGLLAAFRLLSPVLNLVVVAVLRDRMLWGWALCLNHNKEDYYYYYYYYYYQLCTAGKTYMQPYIAVLTRCAWTLTVGWGYDGPLGHSSWGKEPWATVIRGLQKLQGAVDKEKCSN